jgi:chromosome segregation protein
MSSALTILRRAAGDVGEALDRDTAAAAHLETTVERLRRIASVAHERARAARARLEGADGRKRDLAGERAQLVTELEQVREREVAATRQAEDFERRFRELEDEDRSLADQEAMTTEGAVAVVRGDLRSLDAAAARDSRELGAVGQRIDSLTGQMDGDRSEIERLKDEIRDIDGLAGSAEGRYAAAEAARVAEQAQWESAEARVAECRVSVAAASARLEAISEAVEGRADPEARRMAERAAGALGSIVARLDVPEVLAAAVDAALGPWADAIGFSDAAALEAAVGSLKSTGRGGVPMVEASASGRPDTDATRRLAVAAGLEPIVDRLGPEADAGVARTFLGDVVLAEGWLAGRRFVTSHPRLRVVTPEGDLITATGVRVAHPDGATPAMVEAAGAALEQAEIEAARAHSIHVQARRRFDVARQAERDALETLEALEVQLDGATDAMARLERATTSAGQEIERLEDRRRSLIEVADRRDHQRAILTGRLAALEGEEAERQRAWEALVERREVVVAAKEGARHAWQEAAASVRAVIERRTMIGARLESIDGALRAEEHNPADPETIDRLETIGGSARQALDALREHLDVLRRRQAELRDRAGAAGRRMGEVQRRHDELTGEVARAREQLSSRAVEDAELRVRFEAVAEGLRRDADATEDEALAAPRPETGDPVDELATREAELRRMGPINPLASQEYAELAERHGFLTGQLDDLERSREELRKVIGALDDEIQQRFLAAFGEVSAAFEDHFGVLFPGGKGSLRLTDPAHPLVSGVEIEAQPLGKKVARMSLLSGGERSLAALAFLFSIFKARPSPFYVLDEVEAALDDANLRRFLRLLDAFRASAQLVIITHQQQTMETADVLYGVTMEPGGSSTVVAKALTDQRRDVVEPASA